MAETEGSQLRSLLYGSIGRVLVAEVPEPGLVAGGAPGEAEQQVRPLDSCGVGGGSTHPPGSRRGAGAPLPRRILSRRLLAALSRGVGDPSGPARGNCWPRAQSSPAPATRPQPPPPGDPSWASDRWSQVTPARPRDLCAAGDSAPAWGHSLPRGPQPDLYSSRLRDPPVGGDPDPVKGSR